MSGRISIMVKGEPQPMLVCDVIRALQQCKPMARVSMYSDEEGNAINGVLFVDIDAAGKPTLIPFEGH